MLDEIFIIKENGVCHGHFKVHTSPDDMNNDLRSSMLSGIQFGILESFKGEVRCFILNTGKRIYFEDYKTEDVCYKIVIVLENSNPLCEKLYEDDLGQIKSKISDLNMYMEKEGINKLKNGIVKDIQLSSKLKDLFLDTREDKP
jgi:hypothetical protein